MARTVKNIVDYFPHSCNHSKTMFILDNQYGNDGYAFWFRLLEILGKTENHFLDLNKKSDFLFLVAETRITGTERCQELLDLLADLDAIDSELWKEYRVVWVQKFVDNIADVYKKRGRKTPSKPVLDNKKAISGTKNAITVTEIPQSKVKESKVKESNNTTSKSWDDFSVDVKEICRKLLTCKIKYERDQGKNTKYKDDELQRTGLRYADDIRLMLEKDQIDKDNIMQLLEWLYETEGRNALFWKPNIQSAKKLRQKYIQLTAAYEKDMSC